MKSFKDRGPFRNKWIGCLLFLITAACMVILQIGTPKISNVSYHLLPNGAEQAVKLPFLAPSAGKDQIFTFSGDIEVTGPIFRSFKLIGDDCVSSIRINGANIPLENYALASRCSAAAGFEFPLRDHLKPGHNTFVINILDYGGSFGFRVERSFQDPLCLFIYLVLASILVAYAWLITRSLCMTSSAQLIFIGALALRLVYFSYTNYTQRSHDVYAHNRYIEQIRSFGTLPKNDDCFECHQPPAYYLAGAVVSEGAIQLGESPYSALQIFSLLGFMAFLVYAEKFLRSILRTERSENFAFALLAFWPSGVLHSIRIGNDTFIYFLITASLYYTHLWWTAKEEQSRYLITSALLGLVAITVKISGIIAAGVLGAVFGFKYLAASNQRTFLKHHRATIILLVLNVALFFLLGPYAQSLTSKSIHSFNKFDWMDKTLIVESHLKNFVFFDVKTFLKEPFTNGLQDSLGRQYFWNFLLKTSLFGEWAARSSLHVCFAYIMSALVLIMLSIAALGVVTLSKSEIKNFAVILIASLLFLSLTMLYRMSFPIAANSDFRFILPTLIGLAAFYVKGCEKLYKQSGIMIGAIFIALSIFFFLSPLFIPMTDLWRV